MKKNAELPKLKIDSDLFEKVNKTIALLNNNETGIELSLPNFRRMALSNFCNQIKLEGLDISFRGKKG